MNSLKQTIEKDLSELRTMRDELRLQIHLARAEARDVFERLESSWPELEADYAKLQRASGDAMREIGKGVSTLVSDMRRLYRSMSRNVQDRRRQRTAP
jgi:hypothetical protein